MMTTSTTKLAGFGLLIACLCCSTLPLVSSEADIKSGTVVLPHSVIGGSKSKPIHHKIPEVPVKYSGDTTLRENQKEWSVSCEVPPEVTQISWKRNGQVLSELSSGEMTVSPPRKNGTVKVSTLSASEVKPDYEGTYTCVDGGNDSHQITILYDVTVVVVAPKNDSVTIECNEQEGKWFKDDSPINSTDGLPVRKSDGTLIISTLAFSKLAQADSLYGKYSCRGSNGTTDFRVVKKPVVKTEDYQNVVEEEKMHLTCTLSVPDPKFPDPNLKIMWTFKGRNYSSSDGRVKLTRDSENNVKNAVFTLENIEMDDRGNIACVAYYNLHDLGNPQRHGIDTTFVRVKDKYAALWPFLGICAEVVILCLIILIYEKKRNKSELEESDTDQSPDTKPTPNKDSDVRQRK